MFAFAGKKALDSKGSSSLKESAVLFLWHAAPAWSRRLRRTGGPVRLLDHIPGCDHNKDVPRTGVKSEPLSVGPGASGVNCS